MRNFLRTYLFTSYDQAMAIVRAFTPLLGAYLVHWGVVNDAQWALSAGLAGAIVPSILAGIAHTDAALISAAASVPDVQAIVTTPERAKADPSDKVVSQ